MAHLITDGAILNINKHFFGAADPSWGQQRPLIGI